MREIYILIILISLNSCTQKKQELYPEEKVRLNNAIVAIKTSLKDTLIVNENTVIFLRPDSFRFQYYEHIEEPGIYESDSDFGFGIKATMDSIDKNKFPVNYKICDKRYIKINNCIKCQQIIDRDTNDYGIIMISNKKGISTNFSISSIGYIDIIKEYFDLK